MTHNALLSQVRLQYAKQSDYFKQCPGEGRGLTVGYRVWILGGGGGGVGYMLNSMLNREPQSGI